MALEFEISDAQRNAAVDAMVDRLDLNTPPAILEHRTGSKPAINAASTGTLLGTNTFGNPAFGGASGGSATANAITSDTNAANSGTAAHFRIYQGGAGDTAPEAQGSSGLNSGTFDLEFDNNVIVQGGTISISSAVWGQPAGG